MDIEVQLLYALRYVEKAFLFINAVEMSIYFVTRVVLFIYISCDIRSPILYYSVGIWCLP